MQEVGKPFSEHPIRPKRGLKLPGNDVEDGSQLHIFPNTVKVQLCDTACGWENIHNISRKVHHHSFWCSPHDKHIVLHLMFTCCLQRLHTHMTKPASRTSSHSEPNNGPPGRALTPGGRTRPVMVSRVLHIRPFSCTVKYFIKDRWNPNLSCELRRYVTDPFSNQAVFIVLFIFPPPPLRSPFRLCHR